MLLSYPSNVCQIVIGSPSILSLHPASTWYLLFPFPPAPIIPAKSILFLLQDPDRYPLGLGDSRRETYDTGTGTSWNNKITFFQEGVSLTYPQPCHTVVIHWAGTCWVEVVTVLRPTSSLICYCQDPLADSGWLSGNIYCSCSCPSVRPIEAYLSHISTFIIIIFIGVRALAWPPLEGSA